MQNRFEQVEELVIDVIEQQYKIASDNFEKQTKDLIDLQTQYVKNRDAAQDAYQSLYNSRPKDNIVKGSSGVDKNGNPYQNRDYNTNAGSQSKWDNKFSGKLDTLSNKQIIAQSKLDSLTDAIASKNKEKDQYIATESERIIKLFESEYDRGLSRQLTTLHHIAMNDVEDNNDEGYKPWNLLIWQKLLIGLGIFVVLSLIAAFRLCASKLHKETEINNLTNRMNDLKDTAAKESIESTISELRCSIKTGNRSFGLVSIPILLVVSMGLGLSIESTHYLIYYLTTPVGLIMLLFILIDVSPVFYKMMLADGRYDKILHQDKLIEQDLIRMRVAKTLQKVNESELSSLSPFIFGHTFDKIKKILAEKVNKEKKAVELYDPNDEESVIIKNKNKELFEKVLGMKYRIAYASYAAWYKNMYDLNLGYEEIDEEHVDSPQEIKDKFVVMFRSAPEVGGNVSVKNEKDAYSPNSVIEVNAVASEGFEFIGWRDDESAPSKRDITISEDKIYVALFRRTKETE